MDVGPLGFSAHSPVSGSAKSCNNEARPAKEDPHHLE